MPSMACRVRPARPDDAAVPSLLYMSAQPYYDAYAGTAERAHRLLAAVYGKAGHTASWNVCRVAERNGAIAGVSAVFAAADGDALARRFLALTLARMPPWRLPMVMRHLRASSV